MNSVIQSIRTRQPLIATPECLEKIEGEVVKALLSKESIFDGETKHTFEDVLQSIWSTDTGAELIDAELKNIAMGDSDSSCKIKEILTTAAEEYAQTISLKIAKYRFKDAVDNFIASINPDEFQAVRGFL